MACRAALCRVNAGSVNRTDRHMTGLENAGSGRVGGKGKKLSMGSRDAAKKCNSLSKIGSMAGLHHSAEKSKNDGSQVMAEFCGDAA